MKNRTYNSPTVARVRALESKFANLGITTAAKFRATPFEVEVPDVDEVPEAPHDPDADNAPIPDAPPEIEEYDSETNPATLEDLEMEAHYYDCICAPFSTFELLSDALYTEIKRLEWIIRHNSMLILGENEGEAMFSRLQRITFMRLIFNARDRLFDIRMTANLGY